MSKTKDFGTIVRTILEFADSTRDCWKAKIASVLILGLEAALGMIELGLWVNLSRGIASSDSARSLL